MEHYWAIITAIVVTSSTLQCYAAACWGGEVIDGDTDENLHFTLRICDIAHKSGAQINFIYRNHMEEESPRINWNVIHQCLVELPNVIRSLDLYEEEPIRASGSLNIFFITSPGIAQRVVDFINPQQPWKHGHSYLFIWLLPDLDLQTLKTFFQDVWQKNILHAVAALDSQRVFTFEPFASEGFRLKTIRENQEYFYDKLTNFHRFEVRISMFTDPVRAVPLPDYSTQGYTRVDGWLANALMHYLNATALYITPADNESYGSLHNETFTGALQDIHSGFAHIGFNLRYTMDHVKQHIEELYPYQRRFLYLVVPAADMRPEYMIFVRTFSTSLWRLLLLNFILVMVVFMILQYLVERLPQQNGLNCSPKHWHWYELVEVFWKTELGEPVEGFSRISSLRQFLIAWILFSYLVTSMYFGKLESSFVQPTYEPDLDSLNDLNQLNIPIYAYDVVFEAIKVSLQPQYYEVINALGMRVPRHIRVEEFAFAIAQKNHNVALILHDEIAKELLARSYSDATNRPSYHIVKEYLRTLTSSYVVTKGSPFIHKFQTIVSAFHEFGFVRYWMQSDSPNSYAHKSEEFFEDLDDDFDLSVDEDGAGAAPIPAAPTTLRKKKIALNLNIMQGAFYLWLGGILISCVGFAAEWGHWWRYNRRLVADGGSGWMFVN